MSEDFVKIAEMSEIPEAKMKMVNDRGNELMIANVKGSFYVIGNKCTHVGGPLAKGKLEGYVVTCPWHGSQFDVRTGQVARPPAQKSEPSYQVKVEGKYIFVKTK